MESNLNKKILDIVNQYYESTDENVVGVGYGFKKVNGAHTSEKSIIFTVKEKKNISELPKEKILPGKIDSLGLRTDVVVGKSVAALAPVTCAEDIINPPSNRNKLKPLRGGISISNFDVLSSSSGTFGFIARDLNTNSLVGVTSAHVIVDDSFICSDRNQNKIGTNVLNHKVIQPNEYGNSSESNSIGIVKRYLPINNNGYNYADVAIFTLKKEDLDESVSFLQEGLSYTYWLPFATTEEINSLLDTNPELYFSGRTSGARGEGTVKLKMTSINQSTQVSFKLQDIYAEVDFADCLSFHAVDSSVSGSPELSCPMNIGDSGSALIAEIDGMRKIIGIIFAADYDLGGKITSGIANRIDKVAELIQIDNWDGDLSNIEESDINQIESIISDKINDRFLDIDNKRFWQMGFPSLGAIETATPTPTPTSTATPTPTPTPTATVNLNFDPNYVINVTSSGAAAYIINGTDRNGIITNASNSTLNFYSGSRVRFNINATGHPFYIKTVNSTGTSNQASGVTNNGATNGVIDWVVPSISTNTAFYYNCQHHEAMNGSISVNALAAIDNTRPLFNTASFLNYPSVLPQGVSRSQVEIPEPYRTYLTEAITRWSNYIKFNPAVYDTIRDVYIDKGYGVFNGINLDQTCDGVENDNNGFILFNDPTSNTIAYCGVFTWWNIFASTDVQLNTDTLYFGINDKYRNHFSHEEWVDVLTHELGHGLGIGQLWASWINDADIDKDGVADHQGAVPPIDNFLDGDSYTNCRNGYRKVINNGTSYIKIPLEDYGDSGTSNAHFENNYRSSSYAGGNSLTYPGLENELMLGTVVYGGIMKISPVTIGALVDFGYQEVNPGNNEGFVHLDTGGSSLLSKTASGEILPKIKLHNCCDLDANAKCKGVINLL